MPDRLQFSAVCTDCMEISFSGLLLTDGKTSFLSQFLAVFRDAGSKNLHSHRRDWSRTQSNPIQFLEVFLWIWSRHSIHLHVFLWPASCTDWAFRGISFNIFNPGSAVWTNWCDILLLKANTVWESHAPQGSQKAVQWVCYQCWRCHVCSILELSGIMFSHLHMPTTGVGCQHNNRLTCWPVETSSWSWRRRWNLPLTIRKVGIGVQRNNSVISAAKTSRAQRALLPWSRIVSRTLEKLYIMTRVFHWVSSKKN